MERLEVIKEYRKRIKQGSRNKLTSDEQEFLILAFISDLVKLETELEIKARCQIEIALLEEGYLKSTVGKTKLNRYRKEIQGAVDSGKIKLTGMNSREYEYEKKSGTDKTGEIGKAHHHFGWLFMSYDNEVYINFTIENG